MELQEAYDKLQAAVWLLFTIGISALAVTLVVNKLFSWLPTSERKRDAIVKRGGGR